MGKMPWIEVADDARGGTVPEGASVEGGVPEPVALFVGVKIVEGGVPVPEGKIAGTLAVHGVVGEPWGWPVGPDPGLDVVRHIVVVVVANTADVTTVRAFVGQPSAPEAHSVMVK